MSIKRNWHKIAMVLILLLAGFLSFYKIGENGFGNEYYSTAVKSMLSSWHNFFFASFDPGGFVTVDKPALGLWLQVISAKIFGFYGWSLILPEALSTVISVALIYHIVQRTFGKTAGVLSALILALTPILIAVSRTNNLDASLVMVLLFATWTMIVATEKGSFNLLALSVVLVGLGFNIKMLQAFMILPALYIVYFFTANISWRKRIVHLLSATGILLVVSLSWAIIVDLTPQENRPYIGSSQTNSVIELALGYNGIQRITGTQRTHSLDASNAPFNFQNDNSDNVINSGNDIPDEINGGIGPDRNNRGVGPPGLNNNDGRIGNFNNGGPGGVGENGEKGIFRIFNKQLSGQISWLLPMALFGILILMLNIKYIKKDKIRLLILWSAWLATMLVYFSIAGFFHRYYLSMLAPAIAALSGVGLILMWRTYLLRGWKWIILPISILVTAALQIKILWNYSGYGKVLIPIIGGLSLISIIGLIMIRLSNKDHLMRTIKMSITVAIFALLLSPAVWAYTPIIYGSQTALPYAGPELNNIVNKAGMGGNMYSPNNNRQINGTSSEIVEFLLNHNQGEKYLVAVTDAGSAQSIILETGKPVMAIGGFSGSDPILTIDKLKEMVENGEIRYFIIGGRNNQSDIINWVLENGVVVILNDTNIADTQVSTDNRELTDPQSQSNLDNNALTDKQESNDTKALPNMQNSGIGNQNNFRVTNGDYGNQGILYDLAPDKD